MRKGREEKREVDGERKKGWGETERVKEAERDSKIWSNRQI